MIEALSATLRALKAGYEFILLVRDDNETAERELLEAKTSVLRACTRTKHYQASYEAKLRALDPEGDLPSRATDRIQELSDKVRNSEEEMALSDMWLEAAVKIRRWSPELADRLEIKSFCWADPRLFTRKEYREIPLAVDQIFHEARKLVSRHTDPDLVIADALPESGGA